MQHPEAPPGKATKYARVERERRFLMGSVPSGPCVRRTEIIDRYMSGTRLRLRHSIERTAAGVTTVCKLTQKVPAPEGGGPGLITTIYVNTAEYQTLTTVPAAVLVKTRYRVPPLGVDVFGGPLTGLVIAEVEFDSGDEAARFPAPVGAVREVTLDARLSGGTLATTSRSQLLAVLSLFGLRPLDASGLSNRPLEHEPAE
jgi:CYTH domain-containing protein